MHFAKGSGSQSRARALPAPELVLRRPTRSSDRDQSGVLLQTLGALLWLSGRVPPRSAVSLPGQVYQALV